MTQATDTTVTQTPADTTVATPAAAAALAAPKEPSKKSRAVAIFAAALAMRAAGKFDSNKAFRAHVLSTIEAELGVSTASAATMYNSAKKDAETADATVALGRDPKKEKVKTGAGKRGRPAGSKNKAKEVAPATTEAAPAADATAEATTTVVVNEPADTPADAPVADASPADEPALM